MSTNTDTISTSTTGTAGADPDVAAVVVDRLASSSSFTLATAGPEGPWAAGAFFAELDPFTIVLVLEESGRTLRNLRHDPRAGIVVAAGTPFEPFLQAQATAEVVVGDEDAEVRRVLVAKVPEAAPFLQAPVAAVRLSIEAWRATDVVNGWLPGRMLPRQR